MQGVAQRFVKAAEELRLSGAQLFREGIVTNDQVLSKIKNGWQKPPKKCSMDVHRRGQYVFGQNDAD